MQQHRVDAQILYEEQILEAIDQLRRRKARPDADRICNYLLRKFCVDARDTIADLHRLIEAEKVIQVDYKGNTSYRNASKWSRLQLYKNRPEGFVKDKLSSAIVAGAVAELVIEEPDYLDQGVPPFRLIEHLLDGISNPTSRKMVEDFLNKEVANGNIIRSANGNYSLVATSDTSNTTLNSTISSSSSSSSPPPRANLITNHMDNNEVITGNKKFPREAANGIYSENINNINCNSNCGNNNVNGNGNSSGSANDLILNNSSGESYNYDSNNLLMTDSRSSTPKINSPRPAVGSNNNNNNNSNNNNASIGIGTVVSKREQCYEVAVAVKEPNSPEESVTKDDLVLCTEDNNAMATSIDTSEKKEPKIEVVNTSNLKRSSKSERKQRLMVRADDSMDIEIKFDEIKYESKFNDSKEKIKEKEREREREKDKDKDREDSENLSEKEDEEAEAERSSANPSPTLSNPVGGFRSARRKRAKKVFDPSDNNVVKRKRGRHAAAATKTTLQVITQDSQDSTSSKLSVKETGRKCSLCYKDKAESLIPCRDCTVRAHPSCIYSPDDLLQKTGSSWQCERCKSCTVCCETSDIGPLLTCYTCDDAYHYSCHTPRATKSTSKWQCCECKPQPSKQTVTTTASTTPTALTTSSTASTTPTASITPPAVAPRSETPPQTPTLPPVLSPQVSPSRESLEPTEDETIPRDSVIDPNIPDASDWTSEQVYQYFARLFPKEAEVFRMQDIDGHSLLLMKRSDVLIGLDLLLGPALKIYRHVLKLQMRRDETRFYWL